MKVAVFGSTGFMGSALIPRLLSEGHQVLGYARCGTPTAFENQPNYQHQSIDFCSIDDFRPYIDGCEAIFQLISTNVPSTSNANPHKDVSENLLPMIRLLDAMKSTNVLKIIFPSSGGTVYGEPQYTPLDERHPTNPIVSYGATKLAIEKFLSIYHRVHGISPVILRISNPYGPGFRLESPQGAVGHFLYRALENRPIAIWGSGDIVRDYIYIEDVVDAFLAALNYDGDLTTFNISTSLGTSLLDIVHRLESIMQHPLQVDFNHSRTFDVSSNVLSNDLARIELGWSPRTPFQSGLELTSDWLKQQLHCRS